MKRSNFKVLFVVYDNDSYTSMFPMGVGYLAASCRATGYDVTIYYQDVYHYPDEHLTRYLDKNAFDVVGIGACGGYYQYRKVGSLCKAVRASKRDVFLVLGGHLVSPDPEYFLKKFQCDAVVIGEGERTIVDLLDALSNDRPLMAVNGIAYIENGGGYQNGRQAAYRRGRQHFDARLRPVSYRLLCDDASAECAPQRPCYAYAVGEGMYVQM